MAKQKATPSPPPTQEKINSEKQKPGHEIEEIFKKKKRKKAEKTDTAPENPNPEQETMKKKEKKKIHEKTKKKKVSFRGDGQVDPEPLARRRTQDGLTIYSADELGIGKPESGGTPLCPFDCSCCF